ncbi:MAG TPA: phosphomannomutase/phosphoglucomutase [Polyangiaceae bacterium]|jgi:phosphomannomutase/phosphoglucomutase|nr:phosphomannomutase/phosphoglucomutase [Polyangiaceae bacterium]
MTSPTTSPTTPATLTKIPRHAFREYDIRGVADVDLSDDFARALGKTFALMLRRDLGSGAAPRVAVGRDGRLSTGRLFAALTEGLLEGGASVEAVGVGPSPLLYFAAHHLGTDGSVMITASHNPAPDNGFKLMRGKVSLHGKDIQTLGDLIEQGTLSAEGVPRGSIVEIDIQPAYIENVRRSTSFTRTDVRFVVDAGNGAAGPLGVATLRALGFNPDTLFCDLDGRFPNHHPDPTVPKNLEALKQRVLETGAELGVAWDGDGDRIGCIDEKGDVIWGDKLLILFARAVLRDHPGAAILGEVKCSETLYAAIAAAGGRPVMSKTGHSLIKARMKDESALLAGEMSGHMFFADRYPGFDDAIYATARLLEIVGQEGRGVSGLLADVPLTFATPEIRVDCPDAIKFEVVARVGEKYKATHRVIDIDGARIDFGGGAWGLCRASNTQPVLVLRFEAHTEERLEAVKGDVEEAVRQAVQETLAARGVTAESFGPGAGSH